MTPQDLQHSLRHTPDWPRLLLVLRSHGYTFRSLHRVLNIDDARLGRIQNAGYEPSYAEGVRIIALWREVTESVDPVPTLTVMRFASRVSQVRA